jgi:hypothetical protein
LSLLQVSRLSAGSPERIDKGTLSHCERGQQRLSLFKLISLSRIYRVPAEVLIERLELDNEIDRLGGPATEGRDFIELQRSAEAALLRKNKKWDAYALVRDAPYLDAPGVPSTPESNGLARMNLAIVARSLGKNRFALHELKELENERAVGDRRHAILLERISNCYRCLGDFPKADRYAFEAIQEARFHRENRILAFAQSSKASLTLDQGDFGQGREELRRAINTYRDASEGDYLLSENPMFEVSALLKLADADINLKDLGRARRIALAAKRLSRTHGLPIGLAYSELLLGQIDDLDDEAERAACRWTEAVKTARSINNSRLEFAVEFHLLRQAVHRRERALARAARRRMERLAPRVPDHLPEFQRFEELKDQCR